MFTTKCFIRKNTPELTDKIHALGDRSGTGFWYLPNTLLIADECYYYCLDDERGNSQSLINDGYIDCGDNEQLFLALAAMRDDTDNDQLFTNGIDWAIKREAARNLGLPGFEYLTFPRDVDTPLHKATKEEIMNCFQTPTP